MKLRYSKLKMGKRSYFSVVLDQVSKSYDSVYEFFLDIFYFRLVWLNIFLNLIRFRFNQYQNIILMNNLKYQKIF